VLEELTGPQVRGLLAAIEVRYQRQSEAATTASDRRNGPEESQQFSELTASDLAEWGVHLG
jgi:hypothetical protein